MKEQSFCINSYMLSTFSNTFAYFMFILKFMSFPCCLTLRTAWSTFFCNSRITYTIGMNLCPSEPNLGANILKLK